MENKFLCLLILLPHTPQHWGSDTKIVTIHSHFIVTITISIFCPKEMATLSSILAWKNPMDRGAWQATVHGIVRVRDDLQLNHYHDIFFSTVYFSELLFLYLNKHQNKIFVL